MDLSNNAYGQTVSRTSDGTTDYYLVGGSVTYQFPTGTPVGAAYLSITIQTNLLMFKAASQDFVQTLYPPQTQIQMLSIYLAAQASGLTNRMAYVARLLTWINGVLAYSATYVAGVQALRDPAAVVAAQWDVTQFPADPAITLLGAMSIPD